jgi:ferric-dicitrate binding protein FerR (iron transport regulator)
LKSDNRIYYLIARKLSSEASSQELEELERRLKNDPELAYKAELYAQYFIHPEIEEQKKSDKKLQALSRLNNRFEKEFGEVAPENLPGALERKSTGQNISFLLQRWKTIAAIALLVTVGSSLYYYYNNKNFNLSDQSINQFATMAGTRSKTILPDGTTVWLNSESTIHYNADFGQAKREVTLSGEAFFDVTHNEDIPFIVHAKTVDILVKGTAFNVRSYPGTEKVQTSLLRGLVELSSTTLPGRKIQLHPNEKITFEVPEINSTQNPGSVKKPVLSASTTYTIDSLKESSLAAVIPEVSWIENRLVFDNEALTEVLEKMEKWYSVDIHLKNHKIASKQVSGILEKENIEEALKALQLLNDFNYTINGREINIE